MRQDWDRVFFAAEFEYFYDYEWDSLKDFPHIRNLKTMSSNVYIGDCNIEKCFKPNEDVCLAEDLVMDIIQKGMIKPGRKVGENEKVSVWLIGRIDFSGDLNELNFKMVNYQTEIFHKDTLDKYQ
jgi:hypothetical protein